MKKDKKCPILPFNWEKERETRLVTLHKIIEHIGNIMNCVEDLILLEAKNSMGETYYKTKFGLGKKGEK